MDKILGLIYGWLETIYGSTVSEYLWGYNCDTQIYENPNLFNTIGLITLSIALTVVLVYYYVLNHPRLNRAKHWFLFLGLAALINFLIAWQYLSANFNAGKIQDCLIYVRDNEGHILAQLLYTDDFWKFGMANAIVSAGAFTVFSFIFKWGSRNCKHSPIL